MDDDRLVRRTLTERLTIEGYTALGAETCGEAMELFESGVDLVLLDYRLPDGDGLDLLPRLRAGDPDVLVIMLTGHATVERAVEAMRQGAFHYAAKPVTLDEVVVTVERAFETTRLRREVAALRSALPPASELVGASSAIAETRELLHQIAKSPASTVLITGESGTGKDLAARAIHGASARAASPFLNVTCTELPPTLLESELFGHEPGAFTDARTGKKGLVETAHTGTLFLDEIGDLHPSLQGKLLRFLEEKAYRRVGGTKDRRADVRVIAATNIDIRRAVERGALRADLYYRLAVLTVEMPPLRDRDGDTELLTKHFVERFAREFHKPVTAISRAALDELAQRRWPGNVRELRNAVERAVLLAADSRHTLDLADFEQGGIDMSEPVDDRFRLPAGGVNLQQLERSLVAQALERAGGNRVQAGALLGLNRDQVRYRIKKHGLAEPK